ncbi:MULTISPECIES: 2-hydroxychromene-2-carboxylate isomerase [unclassified Corallococcus]|uniref:2-hydroxychromene-2-carboxylate isomerase n=1 Tax=unclassified Corallococcus TaxID=2685029 RepID=UPI001A8D1F65|nr:MULTISPECIES: 2-hydroxychromene-2-carboxylate isomerase [unclassified Corallococcus]MBN9683017.1 2-hydroxychromene-2-carboxylate isomerase [Corallococcus sp. NCSPR001]WAS85448.1 2-hydroxychromene-2-carboxylate isomerase [Corallococcus sp. NCRR]
MASSPLRFCLDYLSPYAYLAWLRMPAIAERHGRELEPVPVLLAGLLNAVGSIGPAEIPAKRVYVFKQTFRIAHEQGAPFTLPPSHPFNPLLSLRVTAAVEDVAERTRLVTALYSAAWGQGRGIETPEQVGAVLTDAGFDARALLERSQLPEVKDRVRKNTEAALAQGAFGVPSVLVDDEMFWGVDSLGHLERFLEGRDPLTPADLERWRDLPATAARRQDGKPRP